jgi:transposase-like protein
VSDEVRSKKRYGREFRLEASRLVVEGGYTLAEAASRLGVNLWTLRDWVRGFRKSGELPSAGQSVPLAEELKAARKEVARLRMENDILKKAAAYFAKESL